MHMHTSIKGSPSIRVFMCMPMGVDVHAKPRRRVKEFQREHPTFGIIYIYTYIVHIATTMARIMIAPSAIVAWLIVIDVPW